MFVFLRYVYYQICAIFFVHRICFAFNNTIRRRSCIEYKLDQFQKLFASVHVAHIDTIA